MAQKHLEVRGVNLSTIKNRNEKRVAKLMPEILDEYYENYIFEHLDIQDIFALTLNLLPSRYVQTGSTVCPTMKTSARSE